MRRTRGFGLIVAATIGLASTLLGPSSQASQVTFGQFFEQNGTQDFTYTNPNPGGASAGPASFTGSSNINFLYSNIVGLPSDLASLQSAKLTLSDQTSLVGVNTAGQISEGFNKTGTLSIIRTTAAAEGNGSKTNLLTVSFGPASANPVLSGSQTTSGGSASFSASTPNEVVTFTSDFLDFSSSTSRAFALSFSSTNPMFALDSVNSFLQSFTAAGSGTFSSDSAPPIVPSVGPVVPEPGTVGMALVGIGGLVLGMMRARRSRSTQSAA